MQQLNWPIETEEAKKFWSSNHKCNTMKAYVAFSKDEEDFIKLTTRAGYKHAWRKRAWSAFGYFAATPSMIDIPFSEIETSWWTCMPGYGTCDFNSDFNWDFQLCEPPIEPPEPPIGPDFNNDYNGDFYI
jgi:hypothetical protein